MHVSYTLSVQVCVMQSFCDGALTHDCGAQPTPPRARFQAAGPPPPTRMDTGHGRARPMKPGTVGRQSSSRMGPCIIIRHLLSNRRIEEFRTEFSRQLLTPDTVVRVRVSKQMLGRSIRSPAWRRAVSGRAMVRRAHLSSAAPGDSVEFNRPTLEDVRAGARFNDPSGYPNDLLLQCAEEGDRGSIRETLTRYIMLKDSASWEDANDKVDSIAEEAQTGLLKHKLPYFGGIAFGFVAAWGSIPMVFDLATAEAFNEAFVTTEHPRDEDLETWLEVGAWTWNWMEPWMGTISFQLLALQFMRMQMLNVGFRPYTGWVIGLRQRKISGAFPEYAGKELDQFVHVCTALGEDVNVSNI